MGVVIVYHLMNLPLFVALQPSVLIAFDSNKWQRVNRDVGVFWVSQVFLVEQNSFFCDFTVPYEVDTPNPAVLLLLEKVEISVSYLIDCSLVFCLCFLLLLLFFKRFLLFD